jgi:hypothetical protein
MFADNPKVENLTTSDDFFCGASRPLSRRHSGKGSAVPVAATVRACCLDECSIRISSAVSAQMCGGGCGCRSGYQSKVRARAAPVAAPCRRGRRDRTQLDDATVSRGPIAKTGAAFRSVRKSLRRARATSGIAANPHSPSSAYLDKGSEHFRQIGADQVASLVQLGDRTQEPHSAVFPTPRFSDYFRLFSGGLAVVLAILLIWPATRTGR